MELRTENLEKSYRGRSVVNQVSIHLNQGEIVGLLGPNGAGKTTTFYMVTGMIAPDAGRIFLNNQDITGLPCTSAPAAALATCRKRLPFFEDSASKTTSWLL